MVIKMAYKDQEKEKQPDKLYSESYKAQLKQYYESPRDAFGEYVLQEPYSVGMDTFYKLIKSQKYKCAICGQRIWRPGRKLDLLRVFVDRNQITGAVRGILCIECNFHLHVYERMTVYYENIISEYLNNDKYDIKYANWRINAKHRKQILEFQDNKCAICGCELNMDTAKLDHDHNTDHVRGVLCNGCNSRLGVYEIILEYKDIVNNYIANGIQSKMKIFEGRALKVIEGKLRRREDGVYYFL